MYEEWCPHSDAKTAIDVHTRDDLLGIALALHAIGLELREIRCLLSGNDPRGTATVVTVPGEM